MARIHRIRVATRRVLDIKNILFSIIHGNVPKKSRAVKNLMKIILVYSAIKINVKAPPLYSVLNPLTNSDSPSARSNGERLVSARMEAIHVKKEGQRIRRGHE